jgi:hypothetical protein
VTTTGKGYPYPIPTDDVDVPGDIQALSQAIDAAPGITSLTQAQIDALGSGDKWAGRVIWNSTAMRLEICDGSTVSPFGTVYRYWSASSAAQTVAIGKARGTASSPSVVQNGDDLGAVSFDGWDGDEWVPGAQIAAEVSAAPGNDDMPSTLLFSTTRDTDGALMPRLSIDHTGRIQVLNAGVLDAPLVTNSRTDSYAFGLGDVGKLIEISKSTGTTLTVPTNATAEIAIGATVTVLQTGAGQVTIAGDTGVTVNATPGLKLRAPWSSATLIKRGTNLWVAIGDLAP